MGWELLDSDTYKPPTEDKKDRALLDDGFHWEGSDIQDLDDLEEAWQWKPTEDHNHAQIVVNRISEMGLGVEFTYWLMIQILGDRFKKRKYDSLYESICNKLFTYYSHSSPINRSRFKDCGRE